jgi:hypothetical protein
VSTTLRTALDGLFDDAGLFPPARRPMAHALAAHERARVGRHGRLVGPFLCPLPRLDELHACVASGLPRPKTLGVIISQGDLRTRRSFMQPGVVQVEAPLGTLLPHETRRARRFLELPREDDVDRAVDAIVRAGAMAKLRCGGMAPDAVPAPERVADTLVACARHGVSLKATAGLHQPFPHKDPASGALQHGFVNLLAAASAAMLGATAERVTDILRMAEDDGERLIAQVDRRGRDLLVAIGTCSIDEPVAALVDLGVL